MSSPLDRRRHRARTRQSPHGRRTEGLEARTLLAASVLNQVGFGTGTSMLTEVPPTPTNLSAVAEPNGAVDLFWGDVPGVGSYEIERSTDPRPGGVWTQIGTAAPGTSEYQDNGLSTGTVAFYRLRASTNGGDSPYSNVAQATTLAPAQSAAAPLFADNFNGPAPSRSWAYTGGTWTGLGGELSQISVGTGTENKALVSTLYPGLPGIEITAKVRVDTWEVGTGGVDATAGVTLGADPRTGQGVDLVFHDVKGSTDSVQFRDDYGTWGNAFAFAWQPGTWYWFTLAEVNGVYLGKVWQDGTPEPSSWMFQQSGWPTRWGKPALDGGGGGASSGRDRVSFDDVTVTPADSGNGPAPAAPPAPSGLQAGPAGTGQIDLSWAPVANTQLYLVRRSPNGVDGWSQVASLPGGTTTLLDSGLAPGTTFYYRVQALTADGSISPESAVAVAATSDSGDPLTPGFAESPLFNALSPARQAQELAAQAEGQTDLMNEQMMAATMPPYDAMRQALDLIPYSHITNVAIQSGNWSDPDTWSLRQVPGEGANVWIMPGRTVTVDGTFAPASKFVLVSGTLQFDTNINTQLRVDTMVVDATGSFVMGTASDPIAAGVSASVLFADNGAIDRSWDPYGISRGLIAAGGAVSVYGTDKTGFEPVVANPLKGQTTLYLPAAPSGWAVGDQVVLTGSQFGQDEEAKIAAISLNGKVVTLDRPLAFNHTTPSYRMDMYVADVARNAFFASENTGVIAARGHTMYMSDSVTLQGAGFYGLGRTDKSVPINDPVVNSSGQLVPGTGTNPRGRYSVHFHHVGVGAGIVPDHVIDCAAVDNPGWTYDNHASDVDMIGNVAYDGVGAGFATENGNEIGVMNKNISIYMIGDGVASPTQQDRANNDYARLGSGFWLQGGGVTLDGDVSAGNAWSAFVFDTVGFAEQAGGPVTTFLSTNLPYRSQTAGVPVGSVAFRIADGVGFASAAGLVDWNNQPAAGWVQSMVFGTTLWGVTNPVVVDYSNRLVLEDSLIFGDLAHPVAGAAIGGDLAPSNMAFINLDVEGFQYGIKVPNSGNNLIQGGYYNNVNDFLIEPSWAPNGRRLTIVNPRFGTLSPSALGGQTQHELFLIGDAAVPNQATLSSIIAAGSPVDLFDPDQVLFNGQQVYFDHQLPGFVITGTNVPGLDGTTNAQLWSQYHLALGGAVAPTTATTDPRIAGGVIGDAFAPLPPLQVATIVRRGSTDILIIRDLADNASFFPSVAILPSGYSFVAITDDQGNRRSLLIHL
ncbi:MAG TPA: G8 domain-containing protein [Isosphaeraceae bacterium]|jgi:hypothetical protein|nr:G8 domain-containing protein [Isosphaeraceae bacterium]